MSANTRQYRSALPEKIRVTVLFTEEELDRIDDWGIPADMPNRSAAIKTLIENGLKRIAQIEMAAEATSPNKPSAAAFNTP